MFQVKKELVVAWSNPKKLKLSDSGMELAQKLANARATADSIDSVNDSVNDSLSSSQADTSSKPRDPIKTNNNSDPRGTIKTKNNSNPRGKMKRVDNNTTKPRGSSAADFSDASWLEDVSLGTQSKQKPVNTVTKPVNANPPGRFVYCYYTSSGPSGHESGDQNDAEVGFEDSVAYLIKCRKTGDFRFPWFTR